jgi:hypothetical protein
MAKRICIARQKDIKLEHFVQRIREVLPVF